MKFALVLALVFLCQCFVADAWLVRCSTFDAYRRAAGNERHHLRSRMDSAERTIRSLVGKAIAACRAISTVSNSARSNQNKIDSLSKQLSDSKSTISALQSRVNELAAQVEKTKQINKCAYSETPFLCYIEEAVNSA